MDHLQHKIYLAELFATYQSLLTDKQIQYFNLTINEDWSLQEIATNFNVSRNAVHDANQKTEKSLLEFETKLQLLAKKAKLNQVLAQYSSTKSEEIKQLIKRIQEVI
jgi:hypothetical protein